MSQLQADSLHQAFIDGGLSRTLGYGKETNPFVGNNLLVEESQHWIDGHNNSMPVDDKLFDVLVGIIHRNAGKLKSGPENRMRNRSIAYTVCMLNKEKLAHDNQLVLLDIVRDNTDTQSDLAFVNQQIVSVLALKRKFAEGDNS